MKRIAALAAVTFGLLAIPAAAMASTGGSGGSGGSGSDTTLSVQSNECYVGYYWYHHDLKKYFYWWQDGQKFTAPYCPFTEPVPLPLPNQCQGQTLVFSVAAGSSALTEVSGPQLSPTEQFAYDGNTYTIMSINPGADQFTAFVNNLLFTNSSGAAITNATGVIVSCWS